MEKYYQLESSEVAQKLGVEIGQGLSQSEVSERLKEGANVLPQKKPPSMFRVLLSQFLSPLMVILVIAAGASSFIGEHGDALVIFIAVLLNAIVGFIQEWKAERAAEALKSFEVSVCTVRRDSRKVSVNAEDLVKGDIVLLAAGARVPADIRIVEAVDLRVEEALLTGESEPSKKSINTLSGTLVLGDQENMAFRGTFILSGRAEGVVVGTGEETAIGDIVKLVSHTQTAGTPIQQQLKKLSIFLGIVMVAVSFGIFAIGFFSGLPLKEIVLISIALAVASIPEGLLVAMTVILSVGMQRMAKHKALVKKLISAETLGSVSVICTDKTGTLTEGHLSLEKIITPEKEFILQDGVTGEINEILVDAVLNNDASIASKDGKDQRVGEPTELALLSAAINAGINSEKEKDKALRVKEIPFSSEIMYMATVHKIDGGERLIVKGAPSIVLDMCEDASVKDKVDQLTEEGFRVLALASKDAGSINLETDLKGLRFLCLFAMRDVLRPDAAKTIAELTSAGIRTVIVTGDNAKTAKSVALSVGIKVDGGVMTGAELEALSDKQLEDQIERIDVFARVDPKDKMRIVKAWQDKGHSVAMKGDGVNDAPAIRRADIGIALGEGADLSKEIADMVLLDSNIATIAAAVKEGRIIFDNIRKVVINLLVDSFSEILLIAGAILLRLPIPITVVQILWINIISDGFPSMALTMEPAEEGLMQEKPRSKKELILNRDMKLIVFFIGIVTDIGLLSLFVILNYLKFDLSHLRTIIFTALTVDSLLYVFSIRTMRTSIFKTNPFANKWLNWSVLVAMALQVSIIYIPFLQKLFSTVSLNFYEWIIICVLGAMKLLSIELFKLKHGIRMQNY